ncbi:uncharacterized protein LOC121855358 [Homarus americanus]|uniref:uncharacterized protein LOC121855358 n=1 Tax=Homarus americanus TaxID=6706 RepID=UPI001C441798|nr:uncharacterized protein LOC121855358 [Homarus americanus]
MEREVGEVGGRHYPKVAATNLDGTLVNRIQPSDEEEHEVTTYHNINTELRITEVRDRLSEDYPDDPGERTDKQLTREHLSERADKDARSTSTRVQERGLLVIGRDKRNLLNKRQEHHSRSRGMFLSVVNKTNPSTPPPDLTSTTPTSNHNFSNTSISFSSQFNEIRGRKLSATDKRLKRIPTKSSNVKSTPGEDAVDYAGRTMESFPTSAINNLKLGTKMEPEYSWLSYQGEKYSTSFQSLTDVTGWETDLSSSALEKFEHRNQMKVKQKENDHKTPQRRYQGLILTSSPTMNKPLALKVHNQAGLTTQTNGHIPKMTNNMLRLKTDPSNENSQINHKMDDEDSSNRSGKVITRGVINAFSKSPTGGQMLTHNYPYTSSRGTRAVASPLHDYFEMTDNLGEGGGGGGGCDDVSVFGGELQNRNMTEVGGDGDVTLRGRGRSGGRVGRVHVVETVVTVFVKDINDNPPVFPNTTMFGEVQENGPIDLSVGVISAWDADDTTEGTNARLTYSIEKNVIHERTGEAIFRTSVRPHQHRPLLP